MGSLQSLLHMLIILASFVQLHVSVHSQCLEEQQLKLIQLKESLLFDAAFTTKLTTWNSSTDCCIWHGVTCNVGGLVVGLDLSDEAIKGGLDNSSSLFELQYLESLNLASNRFRGQNQIPSGIGKLINLRYLNLSYTDFWGQIPIEISQLTRLVILDLSDSILFSLKLENPNLLTLVRNLTMLKRLYLDGVDVGKDWSQAISYSLPNLRVLSLSSCNLSGPIDPSLANLQFLSELHLDDNKFSAPVPQSFANFSNLIILNLHSSELIGSFPETTFQLPLLEVLDLSGNEGLHGYIPEFWQKRSSNTLIPTWTNFSRILPYAISNLVKLSTMDLASCNFAGKIPSSITNLTELVHLNLSGNMFSGPLPSIFHLKDLTYLDFSHNLLSGEIPSTHLEGLLNLSVIDLSYNSFTGKIPSSLFAIPSLQKILLSFNQFGGQIPDFLNESSLPLNAIDLSSNQLMGSVPSCVFGLSSLHILSLSSNKLNGSIQLDWIQKLGNLIVLDLSQNNLTVKVTPGNSTSSSFPQMKVLKLASCNLNQFPDLGNQSRLHYLDLSYNHIRGVVPPWVEVFSNKSLLYLNLSYNLLVDIPQPLSFPNLVILDVHDNQLQGNVPLLPPSAGYVDYSNNNFTSMPPEIGSYLGSSTFFSIANNRVEGVIPASMCNATFLEVLDLSNNRFNGSIPACIAQSMPYLGVLNLRRNNFSGMIPDKFQADGEIETLNLDNNLLEGMIPQSLANCTTLEVLDLGNNQINDKFPCLLKNISSLRVLILRQNKFHGDLECPEVHGNWPRLQILDLASNQFSGYLPHGWLTTWNAMMGDLHETHDHIEFETLTISSGFSDGYKINTELYYQDSIAVTGKGLQMSLVKILTIFTFIDFSTNNFEGSIPESMGQLSALYVLNLSHNAFTGMIPLSLGNLSQLESLDLSNNQLRGHIPQQLAGLTFLSVLNLSNNRLVGRIPEGPQLQSFPPSSYQGNEGLYGPPLTETCSDSNTVQRLCELPPSHTSGKETSDHSSSGSQIDWSFIAAEVGYVFGLGVIFVPLMLWKRWRIWYNGQVECIIFKFFPSLEAKSRNRTIRSPRNTRRRRQ